MACAECLQLDPAEERSRRFDDSGIAPSADGSRADRATGNAALFDWLKQLLPDEPEAPSRTQVAAKLGMTDNALRQAFHRFRHRYQTLLREEISQTVADASEIEHELRHLIAVLRM